jgi:hypothetical protein
MKLLGAIILSAGIVSCSSGGGGTTSTGNGASVMSAADQSKVDKAAAIAKAIQANPERADAILSQNGMTEQLFDDLLYEIASDPEMSRAYSERVGQ